MCGWDFKSRLCTQQERWSLQIHPHPRNSSTPIEQSELPSSCLAAPLLADGIFQRTTAAFSVNEGDVWVTRHWHRLPVSGLWHHPVAQVVASPTLEIFKNHLGVVLVTLLCVSLLEQGLGPDDVQRCLPASAGLCLCEKASAEPKSAGQSSAWCLEELEQSSLTSPVILSQQGRRGARTACQKPT